MACGVDLDGQGLAAQTADAVVVRAGADQQVMLAGQGPQGLALVGLELLVDRLDAIEAQRSDWILGFEGKSLENPPASEWAVARDGGAFDQFTGATVTPRAVAAGCAVRGSMM